MMVLLLSPVVVLAPMSPSVSAVQGAHCRCRCHCRHSGWNELVAHLHLQRVAFFFLTFRTFGRFIGGSPLSSSSRKVGVLTL